MATAEVWLSTEDLSKRYQVPIKTIAVWASTGRGPRYIRVGRYRRYRLADVEAWERELLDSSRPDSPPNGYRRPRSA
ncbi:helix-turn-helix domain-containing protein [Nocardia sp. BMG111209]|uniref:helix-turn-helix domain-containing protein n=1 Tax=Nocardia sp. BMG111209 TaxID=1160137 RepID=UPI0004777A30|nr:helix-turn-helix domain-containing protein [Nocardia sp. BMG111209]